MVVWKFVLKEARMAVLLVVGDSRSGQDFSELLDVVEQRSRTQLAETAYAIDTDESPETVCDNLVARFGTEDQVYVIAVTGPYKGFYKGFGPEDVDSWLEEHFRGLEDHLNYYGR
jgi:hypothetical protein